MERERERESIGLSETAEKKMLEAWEKRIYITRVNSNSEFTSRPSDLLQHEYERSHVQSTLDGIVQILIGRSVYKHKI